MARDALEVLVGTGTLYMAPLGEAFPTDPSVTPAGNWEDIGYSEEGWKFVVDRTFEDVVVAEEVDALRVLKTAQEIRVQGAAAQASLENLQIAFGGGTIQTDTPAVGQSTYTPPASSAFTEYSLLLRVLAPPGDGTKLRDIRVPRVTPTGTVEAAHAKAPTITVLAIDFRAIIPASGAIYDVIDEV
ncbi:MAG: hypothetical protein DRQ39_06145 [Gammaproteobacteria bacterium]|nr:MAG: hypothetical protein DRQ39_06145 [Gammaproteobacteria bacterium]